MLRFALKSLLGRKLRLVLSTFAIVLGVAFVAGTLVFSDTLNRSFTALFASTVGDVVVRPDAGPDEESSEQPAGASVALPGRLVDRLAKVGGAARADGNVTTFGVFLIDADGKVMGGTGPPGLGGNWSDAPAGHGLEGLAILEGREPRGRGEVAVDANTIARSGYRVGDRIPVVSAATEKVIRPRLVGVAGFADGGSLNGASYVAWDTATAQDLFLDGKDRYTDIWVTAEQGVTQDELARDVAEVLPDEVEAVTGDEAADQQASDLLEAIGFLTRFLLIFAGISLVVGAFLIVNTFSILVAQRSRELALLRALGASGKQVTRSVLIEALVLGLLGSTAGLGLGVLLAMGIRAVFGRFGLDLSGQSLVFAPRTVVAAYLIGVLVTMLAAYLPARRTAQIAPVQAMRDEVALPETSIHRRSLVGGGMVLLGAAGMGLGLFADIPRAGTTVGAGVLLVLLGVAALSPWLSRPFLAFSRWVFARLFGTVGNLAGLNALRNPRRTAATASALMIGLALASTMAIVGDSAKASVDKTIAENFSGDFVVSNALGQGFAPGIARRIAAQEGVRTVVRERFAITTIGGEPRTALGGVDIDGVGDVVKVEIVAGDSGDWGDGTVALSERYAEERDLDVGDDVRVSTPEGRASWPVVTIFANNPLFGFPVMTTMPTFEKAGFAKQDNFLVVDADLESGGVRQRIENVVKANPIITVKDQAQLAAEQREPIDQMVLLIFALLGLALVIAVLGIVNTLALSVIERTREVGLLRAIGLGRPQLRRMVTLESVVIAVLGTLLGLGLGVVFGVVLMYSLRDDGLEAITIPLDQLGVFLALSLVVGVLAAVVPSRRAARLDVLDAIATE